MKKIAVIVFLFLFTNSIAQNTYKPWTYWWWMGSSVNEKDITEQLQWMHDNGIGGVHIIPIYGVKGDEANYIPFLSDRWMNMLEHTIKTAKQLDMGVDLSMGTGWPFGGPGIDAKSSASCLKCIKVNLTGGSTYQKDFKLQDQNFPEPLIDLKAVSDHHETINLMPLVKNGKINYIMDKGNWTIYEIYRSFTKQMVKRAAPGAEGLVVDPFNYDAVNFYIERFEKAFKGRTMVRSFYHDSYEYFGSNFTPSFINDFRQRRGYDISPYLHLLFTNSSNDTTERVFQDYHRTMADLLYDNFIKSFVDKSRRMGAITRNQAHGSPGNLLDLYAYVDIPETESFGSSQFNIPGVRVDELYSEQQFGRPDVLKMKFASSAAHVMNKKLIASETFTWLADHFKVALSQVKPQADEVFIAGINHIFYHGIPYSPMREPFPGWLFYASTNFNHNAHFAEFFPDLNQYITNCQQILQETKIDNDILLYFSLHENWKKASASLIQSFDVHSTKTWFDNIAFGKLARKLLEKGYTFDYVSDDQLTQLKVNKGMIEAPGATYRTIVVPDCKQLPIETYQVLLDLASQGAKISFENQYPVDVTGLFQYKDNIQRAASIVQKWSALPNVACGDIYRILQQNEIEPENIAIQRLSFIRKKNQEGRVYFISNLNHLFTSGWLSLNVKENSILEYYDPLTNERVMLQTKKAGGKTEFFLNLPPGQSCFIFEKKQTNAPPQKNQSYSKSLELAGDWSVDFVKGEPQLPKPYKTNTLKSWTLSTDTACWYFSGKANYSISFKNRAEFNQKEQLILDLGDVREMASVYLNGQLIGRSWCVPFRITFPQNMLAENNVLTIEVTNVSYNRIIYLDKIGYRWKKFHEINFVNIRYNPFDASNDRPIPSGLLGPVKIWY